MMHDALQSAVLGEGDFPRSTRDSAGLLVNLETEIWRLNDVTRHAAINWSRLDGCDENAVWSLKLYVLRLIERASPRHAYNAALFVGEYLSAVRDLPSASRDVDLTSLVWYLNRLRKMRHAWKFHHVRAWYQFCSDNAVPGFDDDTLYTLRDLRIPGNKKGVAVLSADPQDGPLNEFEEIALRRALLRDGGPIQERAALWLALAFGTNAANMALLWEKDFQGKAFEGLPASYFLSVPRIKKRIPARSEFKLRFLDDQLANIIKELIEYNASMAVRAGFARPLFCRQEARPSYIGTALEQFAFHFHAGEITDLIKRCVARLGVVSPRTGQPLRISTRRLRYTYASKMVRQGTSARDLAELLDHTDTQHVMVYFNADSRFVERLDAATATHLGPIVAPFMGTIEDRPDGPASNIITFRDLADIGQCGASYVCGLAVGRSCYTCVKFKARRDGPHADVLAQILSERSILVKNKNERMAEQVDETILAVAEVVARTSPGETSGGSAA